jgi:hypothetical protein
MLFDRCVLPRKGERWVDEWMAENCKLLECDQDMHAAMPGLLAFKEQFRGIAGKEYLGKFGRSVFQSVLVFGLLNVECLA